MALVSQFFFSRMDAHEISEDSYKLTMLDKVLLIIGRIALINMILKGIDLCSMHISILYQERLDQVAILEPFR
jgi:hypothetical protein